MNRTKIAWVINPDGTHGFTFNPITGCLHGCDYCYARKMSARFEGFPIKTKFIENAAVEQVIDGKIEDFILEENPGFTPTFWPARLEDPISLKKPSTIFVCYDPETEVLTEQGWKYIKEINFTDKVATLNRGNNLLEYQYPTGILKKQYNGKMYKLKTKVLDLFVTEDHNLYASFSLTSNIRSLSKRQNRTFDLIPAKEVIGKFVSYKRDLNWAGKDKRYFLLKGFPPKLSARWYKKKIKGCQASIKIPIKIWLKFLGFYISEGSCSIPRKGGFKIIISTNNKDKWQKEMIENVRGLCRFLGRKSGVDAKGRIYFGDKRLGLYLKNLGNAHQKFIPREILNLKRGLLNILLDALIKGDGTRLNSKTKSFAYFTVSKQLAGDVQELAIKSGYVSTLSSQKGREALFIKEKRIIKSSPSYRVSVCGSTEMPEICAKKRPNNIERLVEYDGKVFCVEVPNSIIYIRRNGKPVWCGNCSMADLFGDWVPDRWIEQILKVVQVCPQHTFLFLTKNGSSMCSKGDVLDRKNAWYGQTCTGIADRPIFDIPNYRHFLSFEPLLGNWIPDLNCILVNWLIIGSLNQNSKPVSSEKGGTRKEWVLSLLDQADKRKIPVFVKPELYELYPDLPQRQELPYLKPLPPTGRMLKEGQCLPRNNAG